MTTLKIIILSLFLIGSVIISYQDFKSRLISVWAILLYTTICIVGVIQFQNGYALLSNSISTVVYLSFTFFVLFLFYSLKARKFVNIIDSKIGLGDVLILIAIGLTLDALNLILFFTISFSIAAIIGLVLARANKSIPLAGILVWCHFCFIAFFQNWTPFFH